MMLDDDLRRELGKLEEPLPVAHATRYEGVAAFVRMNGPTLVRRARIRRVVVRTAIPAGVIAIAAGVALAIVSSTSEPPRQAERAPTPAPVEAPAPVEDVAPIPELAVQDEPVARECESRARAEASRADSHVELGFAAFSRERRSRVELETLEPCRTELRLTRGSVLVHARDLGGGELAVRTDLGDVVVTGTIFRVTRKRGELVVEVVEGSVAVRTGGTTVANVRAGERLALERGTIDTGRLAADRIARLREIAEEWAPSESLAAGDGETERNRIGSRSVEAEEPADLAAAAEAARRGGDYRRARELWRALAEGSSATAESALVRLARMELGVSGPRAALAVLRDRRARFGAGTLEPEALTIEHTALARMGDRAGAVRVAELLARSYPRTAQGQRAREWLDANR
jgi:hypothetical protein